MKKAITILLALLMVLSLAACGDDSSTTNTSAATSTENTPATETAGQSNTEITLLNVGDTAQGDICDVTVTSVEYVDKIENGLLFHMWSPAEQTNYQDVTAETGYSIIKISYRFDYKGKERGVFP
ncbi:MAG: hypothetical protein IKR21_05255, partial [Oscillospiraceae bacterium]|nr:hypothetical protein [Oscillospiraceae bacterium]